MKKRKLMIRSMMLILVIASLSITTIVAYLADGDTARNAITVGGNNITIDEEYDPEPIVPEAVIPKKVRIRNDGPNACYVRVRAVFSDSDVGQYADIDFNLKDWDYDSTDEYYYYKSVLNKGDVTSWLMTNITIKENIPEEYIKDVDVIIYAESYQSYGYSDYQKAWTDYEKNLN